VKGDRIYNGAMDDASGDASLIEIARALQESGAHPKRSIVFLSVTGEEKGELGSQYFAAHPTVSGPIVADINMDMYLPLFPLQYLEVQGLDESTLGTTFAQSPNDPACKFKLTKNPSTIVSSAAINTASSKKAFHPWLSNSATYLAHLKKKTLKAWYAERYHGPADDLSQPVDAAAAAQFNAILEKLVLRIADAPARPEWKSDSFFRRFVQ
jgi:Zn-dependent M28 family amino/carboxypeptidase